MIESARLKRLLELSRRVERARKGELMAARADLTAAEESQRAAEEAETARARELATAGEARLTDVELRADLVGQARATVKSAIGQRLDRADAVTARELDKLNATRDVRKMEVLWDRDRVEHKRVTKELEQRFTDDTRRPKKRGP